MRSGTLYCNGTLYRKNMARFWPIWAAYAVMWVFILPLPFFTIAGQNREAAIIVKRLADHAMTPLYCLESGVLISAGFGLAAAMAVFPPVRQRTRTRAVSFCCLFIKYLRYQKYALSVIKS